MADDEPQEPTRAEATASVLKRAREVCIDIIEGRAHLGALTDADNSVLAAALVVLIDDAAADPARVFGLLP
jgi:hypothetical protein